MPLQLFLNFLLVVYLKGIQASPTNTFDTSTASLSINDGTEVRVRVYTGVDTGTGCFNDDVITLKGEFGQCLMVM